MILCVCICVCAQSVLPSASPLSGGCLLITFWQVQGVSFHWRQATCYILARCLSNETECAFSTNWWCHFSAAIRQHCKAQPLAAVATSTRTLDVVGHMLMQHTCVTSRHVAKNATCDRTDRRKHCLTCSTVSQLDWHAHGYWQVRSRRDNCNAQCMVTTHYAIASTRSITVSNTCKEAALKLTATISNRQ